MLAAGSEFVLSNLEPEEAEVPEDADPIDVSADVDNLGTIEDTQTIELTIEDDGGAVVFTDSQEVTLDPDVGETVTFEDLPAGDLDPGEYTHEIASEDESLSGNLTVTAADDADIEVSLSDEQGDVGDTVTFDLEAVGIGSDETIGAYDFTIEFDETALEFVNNSEEGVDFADPVANADNGTLLMNAVDLTGSDTPLTLATIDFEILDDSATNLTFDATESEVTDIDGDEFEVEYDDGSVGTDTSVASVLSVR